jgi:hypothetical protein
LGIYAHNAILKDLEIAELEERVTALEKKEVA